MAKRDMVQSRLDACRKEMDALAQQMYEMKIRMNVTDEDLGNAVKAKRIEAGIALIRTEDPDQAAMIEEGVGEALSRVQERELEVSMEERGA